MDVHKKSISIAVRNAAGKIVMECVIETKANIILDFIHGLRGELHVTLEEGTWATWLYDLLKPHETKLVVCDPRKNARDRGNKNDQIDARELADRLYMNKLSSVYHGEQGSATLKELARSYLTISKDLARVMTRVKAIYRSWGIACTGKQVYAPRHRAEWLAKITEVGVLRRAEFYYQQLDALRSLRHEVRRDLLAESKKHKATKLLCQIPSIGPIRAALLIATDSDTAPLPHQATVLEIQRLGHRNAQQCRLPVRFKGQLQKVKKQVSVRGLNRDCNHDLKNIFKGAAIVAATKPGPFAEFYAELLAKGMRPEMARLTLARKIATIVLIVWKRGVCFDAQHLKPQTA